MTYTTVKLRKEQKQVKVVITGDQKPEITNEIKQKWQMLINLVADLFHVPSGLIMKITKSDMEVFLKNINQDNPYHEKDKEHLGAGLYCETVVGKDSILAVFNALSDDAWKDNPDVNLDMISYLGLPIKWSDDEIFGTLCVLDRKERVYDDKHIELMKMFKEIIETDLKLIELNHKLEVMANTDPLTDIPNRNKMFIHLRALMDLFYQSNKLFSIAMIDLDKFKNINDIHGHRIGDLVLVRFARFLNKALPKDILLSRYGGDEFVILLPKVTKLESESILQNIQKDLEKSPFFKAYQLNFTFGVTEMKHDFKDEMEIIDAADQIMMKQKSIDKVV
jgi:diguanylate cyclase (GGDEF)-like protein